MYQVLLGNLFWPSLVLLALTLCGFFIIFPVLQTANKLLITGLSMTAGLLGFLLVLSLGSYFFKGYFGIWLLFSFFSLGCVIFFLKQYNLPKLKSFTKLKLSKTNLILMPVLALYVFLIFLSTHRTHLGGDTNLYFAIATSFAKGNYPTVSSWQPQFLPVYHMGAFMLQGAVASLSGQTIELVHYLFSVFSISALLFLITGIVREKTRSFLSILPAVLAVILTGGPILPFGNLQEILSQTPLFASFQGSNGGGVVSLGDLIYTNFYALGLGAFLVFAVSLTTKKTVLLLVLAALTLSIDETFFLIELPFLALILWKRKIWQAVILVLLLASLMLVLPNPIRDSVFTPQKAGPRFNLLLNYPKNELIKWNGLGTGVTAEQMMESRLKYSGGKIIKEGQNIYYLLDIKLLLILLFISWLATKRDKLTLVLISGSVFSFLLSLVLINTFWPPNALRLSNQAYQLGYLAFGLILINLLVSKQKTFKLTGLIILVVLIPSLITAHRDIISKISVKNANNFTKKDQYQLLGEINQSIPVSKVTLFLDRFPNEAPHSVYNYISLTYFGAFVPLAPASAKILNPDPGIEWFDGVNNLAPYALNALNVQYVYVQDVAWIRLSEERKMQLGDKAFFEPVKKFKGDGTLFRVKDGFKKLIDSEITVKSMADMIGRGKNVYIGQFKFNTIRKGLILELAQTNRLFGAIPAHGGDFFMNIEANLPISPALPEKIDYALADPAFDPASVLPGSYKKITGNSFVALWKFAFEDGF